MHATRINRFRWNRQRSGVKAPFPRGREGAGFGSKLCALRDIECMPLIIATQDATALSEGFDEV